MAARLGILAFLAMSVGAVLGAWLWYRLRPVQRYEVGEVAAASGLLITADNVPIVVESIATTRLWRTVGVLLAIAGLAAAAVFAWTSSQSFTVPLTVLLWGLVGYWVGSVIAEFSTARALTSEGPRSASLSTREMRHYVGPWASQWPLRLAVVGGLSAVVGLALGDRSWWLWASGLGAVVVALVTRSISRYVLDRAQPVQPPDVAAADDAVRSRSLHALGGTAVGIETWLASLAVGGAVSVVVARFSVEPAGAGSEGATSLLAGTTSLVVFSFAVVVPLVGFLVGRRLARRPFRMRPPLEVAR